MNTNKQTTDKNIAICKGCGIQYNRDNVARVYGKESSVLLAGYHSADCYTIATTKETVPIDKDKGLIEICGSVVPISEVERIWKLHCTTQTTETAHKKGQLPEWKVSEWMIFETGRKKAILEGIIDYYLYDVEETKQRLQLAASAPQLKAENDRLEILLHAKKTVIEILFKEIDTIKNQKAVLLDALKISRSTIWVSMGNQEPGNYKNHLLEVIDKIDTAVKQVS